MPRQSKAALRRSAAAKKGWQTRRHNERSAAAKKGWRTRRRSAKRKRKQREVTPPPVPRGNVEFMVFIDYRRKKRGFAADLVIVAPATTTVTELADMARKMLSRGKKFLANVIEGAFSEVTLGDPTNRKPSVKVRSFQRYKP